MPGPGGRTRIGARQPASVLHGPARTVALILHVLASAAWFGIAVSVVIITTTAATTADESFAHDLYRVLAASPRVSVTAGLLGIATGAVLGLGTQWGLIRHWWVVGKILLAVIVVGTDAVIISAVASDALATGRPAPPLFGATSAHAVLLVIATALAVIKPRGLTPWGRRVLPAGRRLLRPATGEN